MTPSEIKRKIRPVLKKNGVKRAGLFGSFARGEARKNSDVDILVDLKAGSSLLDLVRIERELSEILNRDVDLVTYRSLNPRLRDIVLADEKQLV